MCPMSHAWFGGSGGLLFPLPAGRMCAYSFCFPAVAAQVWAGQSSGTHMTLLALCPAWLSLFVSQTGSCCAQEIPSPLPPSLSIRSLPLASPSTGCRHSFPMGMGLGAGGTGPAAGLAEGSLTAGPLPRDHTRAVWSRTRASQWDLFSFCLPKPLSLSTCVCLS